MSHGPVEDPLIWIVLGTRQTLSQNGQVVAKAHAVLFSTEVEANKYAVKMHGANSGWIVKVGGLKMHTTADTTDVPAGETKEN